MSKIKEPSFELEDDENELEDDEIIPVVKDVPVKKTAKKVAKKVTKKAAKVKAGPSRPVAVRLPVELIASLEQSGVDVAKVVKSVCEDIVKSKKCPTCGHTIKGK